MNSVYLILLLIHLNRKLAQFFPVTTARVRLGTSFKTFASGHPHFKEARFLSHILGTLPSGREEVGIQVIISCTCTSFTESNIIPVDEKRRVSINRLQAMSACVRANVRVTSEKENNTLNLIYSIIAVDRRKAVTRKTTIA